MSLVQLQEAPLLLSLVRFSDEAGLFHGRLFRHNKIPFIAAAFHKDRDENMPVLKGEIANRNISHTHALEEIPLSTRPRGISHPIYSGLRKRFPQRPTSRLSLETECPDDQKAFHRCVPSHSDSADEDPILKFSARLQAPY